MSQSNLEPMLHATLRSAAPWLQGLGAHTFAQCRRGTLLVHLVTASPVLAGAAERISQLLRNHTVVLPPRPPEIVAYVLELGGAVGYFARMPELGITEQLTEHSKPDSLPVILMGQQDAATISFAVRPLRMKLGAEGDGSGRSQGRRAQRNTRSSVVWPGAR